MAEYSMSDFAKMQMEAAERVREMGRRSRDLTGTAPHRHSMRGDPSEGRGAAPPPGPAPGPASGRAPGRPDMEGSSGRPGVPCGRSPKPGPPPRPEGTMPPDFSGGSSTPAPGGSGWPGNLLSGLGNDRALILLLLLLLGDGQADRVLLLALAYLAL